MVTWRIRKPMAFLNTVYSVGDCLSTDTKPTEGIFNGSCLYEMDTKKSYKYDEENTLWREAPSGSGGGGGTVETLSTSEVEEILNG